MAPWLSGQISILGGVLFVSKSLLGIKRPKLALKGYNFYPKADIVSRFTELSRAKLYRK